MSDPTAVAAGLIADADPEVAAALRAQLGLPPEPTPDEALAAAAAQAASAPRPVQFGVTDQQTVTVDAVKTSTGGVTLVVPGEHGDERYECGPKPPAQVLIDAIEIHNAAAAGVVDHAQVVLVMRALLMAVLLPGSKDRYTERMSGYTTDGLGRTLEPIGLPEMMIHGTKLLEVYTGRPLGTASTSTAGSGSTEPT